MVSSKLWAMSVSAALPCMLAGQIKIPAQLSPATSQAFDQYVAIAEKGMDWKARTSPKPAGEVDVIAMDDSPISIKDGLIHDWVGGVLMPGISVDKALAMFRDYAGYKKVFSPEVLESQLLSHSGNRWNSSLRIGRRAGLTTVTFDTEYATQYKSLGLGRWAIESRSTKINELDDNNKPLPEGTGQGFLWRLNSYWLIEPRSGGLYLECRAISLSRDVPNGLGWIVKPIIASLPRDSLKSTVEEARKALR
ncbi:MAG TPA: hypothetical protein VGG72_06255 [Bryobacteraceae bacterium]